MKFEPEKFFIGVIDFFSVLLPGGILAYLAERGPFQPAGTADWMVFLFKSYLLGHLIFLFGSLLDGPYDVVRSSTPLGQTARLAEGKKLSPWWLRMLGGLLFKRKPDAALVQAVKIKWRTLSPLGAQGVINTFQYCKARLLKDHSEGLIAVKRLEADSKFFRSFAIVLMLLPLYGCFGIPKPEHATWGLLLLLPALWRYVEQRFKATQQAYWSVITLESLKAEALPDQPGQPDPSKLTHAGGVVYQTCNDGVRYLLVQASANPDEWVLPKGHIELGEAPRETAVREVFEETGQYARVKDWLGNFQLGEHGPLVRFFLMESVEEYPRVFRRKKKEPYPEDRQSRWLPFDDAIAWTTQFPETQNILEKARNKITGTQSRN